MSNRQRLSARAEPILFLVDFADFGTGKTETVYNPGSVLLERLEKGNAAQVELMRVRKVLKDVIEAVPQDAHPPAKDGLRRPVAPPPGVIWFLVERQYQVGSWKGMVACDDDALLKAFLDNPALDGPALRRLSRVKDAGRVLRRLRNRYGGVFREAIHCPGLGGKGTGGYKVCVQTPPAP